LPIIQARPGNGLDIQKRGSFGETSDEPYLSCAQSAAVLPLAYGKLLDRNVMRQDPFYAIHELFAFAAASEQQFLNLVQAKMEDVAKHPFTTATALSELTYFTTILNRHIERLEENVSAIKTRGDTRWPRANDSRIYIADAAADKLLRDFECLTERAKLLSRRCDLFMSYTMSKASLEGSHFAMRQSDSVMLLTVVTLIFLPLTFVSALFSMNVSELLMGSVHLWAYFAVAGPLALLALVAWWATYWSGRKKWTNLFLDRFFHVIKRKQL
jgi:Mg2+ and Co2+ transporter CorA